MGNLVFQATLGGQVNLVGPNTASTYNINVPTVNGNMVTTGDTGTVTNTMCATSVYTAPGTIGSGTPNTGAFTTLTASTSMRSPIVGAGTSSNLSLQSNATTQATLDTSGNLGLGVTPSAWNSGSKVIQIGTGGTAALECFNGLTASLYQNTYKNSGGSSIYVTSNYATQYYQYNGTHVWQTAPSGTAGNAITFTQAMTLDASGNLGVGNTIPSSFDPAARNVVVGSGSGNQGMTIYAGSASAGSIYFANGSSGANLYKGFIGYIHSSDAMQFATGGSERARIDSSGNLLLMTTSSSITADVGIKFVNGAAGNSYMGIVNSQSTNASANYHLYSTGAGAYRFYVGMGGTIYATSTSISALSDQTLKTNIRDLETGLAEVMALQPRRFDWINGDASNVAGFVAQEVEQVLPELVTDYIHNKDEDGNNVFKKSLKMGDILPTLVKALQEMKTIIDQQAERIAALEAK